VIRHIILNIIGVLSATFCSGQDTYVKSFKVFETNNSEFATVIQTYENDMFVGVHGLCEDRKCLLISKLDNNGNIIWNKGFIRTDGGNYNFLRLQNDTLFASGHTDWNTMINQVNVYVINPESGDSLYSANANFDSIAIGNGFANMGLLIFENKLIPYGEIRDTNNIVSGLIHWMDMKGVNLQTKTYQLPGNFTVNALQDLQPDGYGNLVFVMVYQDMIFDHTTVIRKLNANGDVIKDVRIASNETLDPRPQLAVNKVGQYVFSHAKWAPGTVQQLVCSDTLGNILWEHDYPLKINGQQPQNLSNDYHITQITPTSDGGVVITAIIRTNRIQNRFYDDAYIGKFDMFGTLEWERRINIQNGADTLYDWCALYDIKEKPDGKGYVAVGSHIPSHDLSTSNILLVSLDADGCIEGMVCDGDQIIVSTLDVIDLTEDVKKVSLFPNPVHESLQISGLDGDVAFSIYNQVGALVQKGSTSGDVDVSGLPQGMYMLTLTGSNPGDKTVFRFVKM
jgi:hypothetical protein